MLKKFRASQLILITLFVVMVFIADLALVNIAPQGSPQQAIAIPLTLIISGMLIMLLIKILPKFGVLTLFALIYVILEFPTPLGVAPGFWPKIIINILSALLGDAFIYAFRYKNWSIFVGAWIFGILNQALFIIVMIWFGIPSIVDKLSILIIPLALGAIVFSGLGLWLGLRIWQRIKNKKIIKQISC